VWLDTVVGEAIMPVEGIGGLFFRAKDPAALTAWYLDHLDVGAGRSADRSVEADRWVWTAMGGPVVFSPFEAATDYFAADKAFMINFRVSELDALLDRLRAAGIEVTTNPDWDQPGVGRFARIHDPEGNAVELWEPSD
jgi:predicted enzyme related to lactoylglutathione lyase